MCELIRITGLKSRSQCAVKNVGFVVTVWVGISIALTTGSNAKLCAGVELIMAEPQDFVRELSGCTEIGGSLTLARMEYAEEDFFEDLYFPELVAVRGYFLVFRVAGLYSLGNLFPNLTVVKGNEIIKDVSVVIDQVFDLEEVRH